MFFSSQKTAKAVQALAEQVADLQGQVLEQRTLIDEYMTISQVAAESISTLDARVTGLGAELSRQLHELGNDIEQLTHRADDNSIAESLAALKSTQVRLATEQARYQITFRNDLAELAELLQKRTR